MLIDPALWPTLSRLLDEWMDLPPDRRAEWLAKVERDHAELVPQLRHVLREPDPDFLATLPQIEIGDDSLSAGASIGPYLLARELGRGGMGMVWLASRADGVVKRDVAIKFPYLHLQSETIKSRFTRERDILARLEDSRIARLYDAGVSAQGRPYLVLEYVEGQPITAYCDERQLDLRARLKLFLEVLSAVQYAHANLVVHRDLKPSNILVTSAGQVRLLDFGIAKFLEEGETAETEITRVEGRALTPHYASPEQIAGQPITTATDVYSLGVLLRELLSDKVHGDMETIVRKATHEDARARYPTADAFAQDIGRFLAGQPVLARPESRWYRAQKFILRNKLAVSAAALVILAIGIGGGVAAVQKRRADREAATARAVSEFLQKDLLAQAGSEAQAGPGNRPDPDLKVRTALDRAAGRLAGKFPWQPAVEAAIRQTIGDAYRELGLYKDAEKQMVRALDLRQSALGVAQPDTSKSMEALAEVYQSEGKYSDAEKLLHQLLDGERSRGRQESLEAISAAHTLAMIAGFSRADFKSSEAQYKQVLEIERRVLGEADPTTQTTMSDLAAVLARESKFAEAESLYQKVVEARKRTLGADHPRTLATMNGLGVLYRNEGKAEEAESWLTAALEGRRRAMGPDHRDTLASMNGLGLLYSAEGKYDRAEPLLTEAAGTAARVLGGDNPDAQSCLNNLADLYAREGKLKESSAAFERLLDARLRTYGPDNAFTATTWANLGEVKFQLHAFKESTALLTRAVDHYKNHKIESWRRYYTGCLLGASLAGQANRVEGKAIFAAAYQGLLSRKDTVPYEYKLSLDRAEKLSASMK